MNLLLVVSQGAVTFVISTLHLPAGLREETWHSGVPKGGLSLQNRALGTLKNTALPSSSSDKGSSVSCDVLESWQGKILQCFVPGAGHELSSSSRRLSCSNNFTVGISLQGCSYSWFLSFAPSPASTEPNNRFLSNILQW